PGICHGSTTYKVQARQEPKSPTPETASMHDFPRPFRVARYIQVTPVSLVTLRRVVPLAETFEMQFSRTHLGIAIGAASLLVLIFLGYLWWLSNQPPVLARSEERDPLTHMPLSITMNPFRDRTIERTAASFIKEMRDGNCRQALAKWEKKKDYRKKRADFICDSESQHP